MSITINNKSIVCLVLARGGSKGIPRKNIKLLNGKPLLSYILEEAKKCLFFDDICVSTDDQEISDIADDLEVTVIKRPPELATDTAKSIDAVKHALTVIDADYVVLLNACTPFNDAISISELVEIGLRNRADSVVSLVESFESHPSKLCHLNEDNLVLPLGEFETGERQKLDKIYRRNTCMYMASKETIMSGSFFGKKNYGYIMPPEKSIDINSMWEFLLCEAIIKNKLHEKLYK